MERPDWSRRQIALAVVAIIVVLVVAMVVIGVLGAPTIQSMTNEWGEVDDDRVEVLTDLQVDNPNPVGLGYGVSGVNYTVDLNDVGVARGGIDEVDLPSGQSQLDLETTILAERIPPWWVSHLQNGERSDLAIDATIDASLGPLSTSPSITHTDVIETDLIATLDDGLGGLEGEHQAASIGVDPVSIEPSVRITDTNASWGAVSDATTELRLTFDVTNPNAYPIPTPAFAGSLAFNDVAMGEWEADDVELTNADRGATISPGETRELTFAVTIDNERIGDWFPTHVDRTERTTVRLAAQLVYTLNDYTVTVPPEGEAFACTFDLQTAMLVDQTPGVSNQTCAPTAFGLTPSSGLLEELGAATTLDTEALSSLSRARRTGR